MLLDAGEREKGKIMLNANHLGILLAFSSQSTSFIVLTQGQAGPAETLTWLLGCLT